MKTKSLKQILVVGTLSVLVLAAIILIYNMVYAHKFATMVYEDVPESSKNQSKEDNADEFISFDDAYLFLDYKKNDLSNVERCHLMESKSSMLNARSVAMIEYLSIRYHDNFLWRHEAEQWERLSENIQTFITAKMEEQWETGKTGTAGSSNCSSCQYILAIARAVYLETIIANPQEPIFSDDYHLYQYLGSVNDSNDDVSFEIILNRIRDYLNAYKSNPFYEWRDKDSFYDWHREVESTIQNILTLLPEYLKSNRRTIESMNDANCSFDYLQYWLLEEVERAIKIGD